MRLCTTKAQNDGYDYSYFTQVVEQEICYSFDRVVTIVVGRYHRLNRNRHFLNTDTTTQHSSVEVCINNKSSKLIYVLRPMFCSTSSFSSGVDVYFVYSPTFRPPIQAGFLKAMFLTTLQAIYH